MMFQMTINSDNAAFEEPECELARILRTIANKVEAGQDGGAVMDVNGNKVGTWCY